MFDVYNYCNSKTQHIIYSNDRLQQQKSVSVSPPGFSCGKYLDI